MNTKRIGNIGEAVAIAEFTKRDIPVLVPFGDAESYDLVIDLDGEFKKVQVKTTEFANGGIIVFKTSKVRIRSGKNVQVRYTGKDIDYLFLYCLELGTSYLVQIEKDEIVPTTITVRIEEPKSPQRVSIRMEADCDIDLILNK